MKLLHFLLLAGLAALTAAASTPSPLSNVTVNANVTAAPLTTSNSACPGCKGTADIDAAFTKFDFAGGCAAYKSAYDCSAKCTGVQASLTAFVGDLCVPQLGGVSVCGQKLKSCVTDLQNANAAAVNNNKKTLCSDITTFFTCSNDALVACSSKNSTAVINQLTAAVSELDLESGCNGECAASVGYCLKGLTKDVMSLGNNTIFKQMCQQLDSAPACIEALKATVCAKTQTGLQLAEDQITKAKGQESDLCGANGAPTPCASGFVACGQGLNGITADNGCQVMSSYLTCAERLPCKNSIEDDVKAQIKQVTQAQNASGCANVGGCADRIKNCVNRAISMLNTVKPDEDLNTFCNMSQQIEQCFIVVRQDPNCKYENLEASDDETKFFTMFASQCGNATACSQAVDNCKNDYHNLPANANVQQKCAKVGDAVTCLSNMLNSDICARVGQTAKDEDKTLATMFTKDCGNPSLCDQGIKACYQPVLDHNIINDPDSKKVTDCPIINTAVTCMDNMAKSETCKIFQKNITSIESAVRTLDSGFCNTASSCDSSITACEKDYKNVPASADQETKCLAVGQAVSCINLQLQAPICAQAGKQAGQDEQILANNFNQTCGNPALCDTELNSCFKPIMAKVGTNTTTAQDCPAIKTALACIDTISKAWTCKIEQQNLAGGAALIRAQDAKVCGAGVAVQASILMIALSLFSHLLKKF